MEAPEFLIDGERCTKAEMLQNNADQPDVIAWAQSARPGDQFRDALVPVECVHSEANARLIAAATEMFDVLTAILRAADGRTIPGHLIVDENSPLMGAARAAIAAATGSTR